MTKVLLKHVSMLETRCCAGYLGWYPNSRIPSDCYYKVTHKLSAVNYQVEEIYGRKRKKTVHVNNTKCFRELSLQWQKSLT